MTLVWFIVWLVSSQIGDNEVLRADPVNGWAATLILAVALDLGRQHANTWTTGGRRTPGSGA
jgi:hypothetical protein